jgi:hypothetical protein
LFIEKIQLSIEEMLFIKGGIGDPDGRGTGTGGGDIDP